MTFLVLAALAAPGDPLPVAIVAGEDIREWGDLLASRPEGDSLVAALEEFLVAYPESPLAEIAWTRLRDVGALEAVQARHPELNPWWPDLARSRAQHEEELARAPVATAIVPLDERGEPPARPRRRPLSPRRPSGT